MPIVEEATINAPRKKKKKAAKKRAKRNPSPKPKKRRAAAKKAAPRRRKRPLMVQINSPQKSILDFLKDAALVGAGALAGKVAVAYAEEKVEFMQEAEWAAPVAMVGAGVAAGTLLKGKNRKFGTLLGLGSASAGVALALAPYLAGKLPGFEEFPEAAEIPAGETGAYLRTGMGAYMAEEPPLAGLGMVDPFGYTEDDLVPSYGP